jgi:maltose O-acetyltransferase
MSTEKEKMLAGELYNSADPQLVLERRRARDLLRAYNATRDEEGEERTRLLRDLLAAVGAGAWIEPPFQCDFGSNITLGEKVYFNFNCVILDCSKVTIGDYCFFAPGVQVYAATHPLDPVVRRTLESARPVTIGDDVWVGGGAIILPGITIGSRSVIGAGSVVTRDVPEGVVVAGNPARVIRRIDGP